MKRAASRRPSRSSVPSRDQKRIEALRRTERGRWKLIGLA
jgi:hypothetical protein